MARADPARAGLTVRCAIYTRKSSDEGLEQEFNSLDAQREACEAYIVSQRHAGRVALANMYDDGGLSGGSMERPALKRLLEDIKASKVAGGQHFSRGALYLMLQNRLYRGEITHQGTAYPGQHKAILDPELWQIVQDKLAANRQERSLAVGAESLLAGLIADADGIG